MLTGTLRNQPTWPAEKMVGLFKSLFRQRKLDQLFDELKRIAAEDREYHSRTALSEQDHHAYVTRQTRRLDVLHQIAQINARNLRQSERHLSLFVD